MIKIAHKIILESPDYLAYVTKAVYNMAQLTNESVDVRYMFVIIVNPTAGGGRAVSVCKGVCELLRSRSISYRIENTSTAGHATTIARAAAASSCSAIVAVGGDGTLCEIAAGLSAKAVPLYFAPCGTGNDFVRVLNLPSDPVEAVRAQLDGTDARLDMATVNAKGFMNVAGSGFDVDVLREVIRYKHVGKGLIPYLLGLISALKKFHSFEAELTLDTGEVLHEAFTIISIANGRYFGGGMKVAPLADPHDGLLDVMIIRGLPKWAVPFLLPLFITGLHAKIPSICRVRRCKRVRLVCPGMTFNMDGELFDMDEADVRILPGHLPIRLPAAAPEKKEEKAA